MANATPNAPVDPRLMLWLMFLASSVVYVFVAMMAVTEPKAATVDGVIRSLTTDGTSVTFSFVAVVLIIASIVLARTPLASTPKDFSMFLIRCAIAQMPALFGIVIALSTSQLAFTWIGSAITVMLLLLNKPSTASAI